MPAWEAAAAQTRWVQMVGGRPFQGAAPGDHPVPALTKALLDS